MRINDTLDPRWDFVGPCKCGGCNNCLEAQGYVRCEKFDRFCCECEEDKDNEQESEEVEE